MTDVLEWDSTEQRSTWLRGYLSPMPFNFEQTVARLKTASGQDPATIAGLSADCSVEFLGRYNGAPFTLYDYCGDRLLHIGGNHTLDVTGLIEMLRETCRAATPSAYQARVPTVYGGERHGWQG